MSKIWEVLLSLDNQEDVQNTLKSIINISFYSHVLIFVIGVISLTGALVVYRKASYDKIQIAGLFLFVGVFIMEFAISLYRKYSTAERILGLEIAISFITPFTYAVTISVLYIFIFELNRIRIVLQGVDLEKKYK